MPQPSLHQIAAHAGVSVSTVSRFVNGQLTLKPETQHRVESAMTELGYTRAARRARARAGDASRVGVIAVIVPQIGSSYFARIAERIVAAAESHGLSVLIASTHSRPRNENDYVELFAERAVDAIIYAGNHTSNSALASIADTGLPVVVIDEEMQGGPSVDTVVVDDYAGAYQAVAHLASMGHTRISFVAGPAHLTSVAERTRGYMDALMKAGIDPDRQVRLHGAFSEEFGVGALSHLLAADEPPSAVFAASDTIALGVLTGASNLGVRIPEDLSVVGFDDVPAASYVNPRLTTVRMPADRMANAAVAMIAERLDGSVRTPRRFVLPVALILGGTVANVRAEAALASRSR